MGQLQNHRRAYALQKRIDRVAYEVAQMAEVALNFEQYMRDHFGPLQGLLEQVAKADASLHRAVAEIEEITQQILQQGTVPWIGSHTLDQRMLHFLTTSTLKKRAPSRGAGAHRRQDGTKEAVDVELATHDSNPISVCETLDNIQLLIDVRLALFAPLEKLWVNSMGIEFVLIQAGIFTNSTVSTGALELPFI